MKHDPFNVRLYRTRSERRLTMTEVHAMTGIAPRMQNLYESGAHIPGVPALTKIAICMDVSVDYLLGLTDDRRRHGRHEAAGSVGERLKTARGTLNLSQDSLAQLLRTSRSRVAKWEAGQYPGFWSLAEIAAKCKVSADWLVGLSDNMEPVA